MGHRLAQYNPVKHARISRMHSISLLEPDSRVRNDLAQSICSKLLDELRQQSHRVVGIHRTRPDRHQLHDQLLVQDQHQQDSDRRARDVLADYSYSNDRWCQLRSVAA
jgi:nickel-dependent lactate racemase